MVIQGIMKKLIAVLVVLVVGIVVVLIAASLHIGAIVKKGVETIGPQVTQVDVKLGSASVSLLGGSGSISGLVLGNPPGYKSESAIRVGQASLSVAPGSLFSDKIVIRSINVQAPEITIEGGLKDNNLSRIQKNIEAFAGGGTAAKPADNKPPEAKPSTGASKKLEVDDLVVSGAKINAVILGKTIPLTMPDIHLTGLGQGPDGITAEDLAKRLMNEIVNGSLTALAKKGAELGSELAKDAAISAVGSITNSGKATTDSLNKTTKGFRNLIPKKN
jgi:uncharacterized protein involved in outer membrane biogenesis